MMVVMMIQHLNFEYQMKLKASIVFNNKMKKNFFCLVTIYILYFLDGTFY
jgi:hypothetical protein